MCTKLGQLKKIQTLCASPVHRPFSPVAPSQVTPFQSALASFPKPPIVTPRTPAPSAPKKAPKNSRNLALPRRPSHRRQHVSCTALDSYVGKAACIVRGKRIAPPSPDKFSGKTKLLNSTADSQPQTQRKEQKLASEYLCRILRDRVRIKGKVEETSRLFEDFFGDFAACMPDCDGLFLTMKNLAHSLRQSAGKLPEPRSPAGVKLIHRLRQVSFSAASDWKLGKDQDTTRLANICPLQRRAAPRPLLGGVHRPGWANGRNSQQSVVAPVLTGVGYQNKGGKAKNSMPVPKLKLEEVDRKRSADFNDEFNAKYEEFSSSWRKDIQRTRTFNK